MKIKQIHFEHIKTEVNKILNKDLSGIIQKYENGNFPRAEKVQDLQKRFCFDIFYQAGLTDYACKVLYTYLNDDHIYTALKRICPTVKKLY